MAGREAMAHNSGKPMEISATICTFEELHDLNLKVHEIVSDWGVTDNVLFEVALIVEECCSNSVKYGALPVEVGIRHGASVITIIITDGGKAFDPTTVSTPDVTLPLEERDVGGLGLYFVNHFADSIVYSRENGRNILKIEKKL